MSRVVTPHKKPSRKQQVRGALVSGLKSGRGQVRKRAQSSQLSFGGFRSGGGGGGQRRKGMFSDPLGGGGAVGYVIALVMFMAMLYYLSSLNPLSPITNSSIANSLGCNTCGPGGTPGGAYTILRPFGILFYASLPMLFAYGLVRRRQELEGETLGDLEE